MAAANASSVGIIGAGRIGQAMARTALAGGPLGLDRQQPRP